MMICCKYTDLKISITHQTRTFSRLFQSHKILLLAFMTDIPTLSYTITSELTTLQYTWSLKKVPLKTPAWEATFRAEPSRIGCYKVYPIAPGSDRVEYRWRNHFYR